MQEVGFSKEVDVLAENERWESVQNDRRTLVFISSST